MKHIAKKRFGQNFLTDQSVISSLVNAIAPKAEDLLVEIGPGLGALTKPLIQRLNLLHVVEVDRDIIAWMEKTYVNQPISIHNADALKFRFTSLGDNLCGTYGSQTINACLRPLKRDVAIQTKDGLFDYRSSRSF